MANNHPSTEERRRAYEIVVNELTELEESQHDSWAARFAFNYFEDFPLHALRETLELLTPLDPEAILKS